MGALVYELLDRPEDQGGVSAAARRVLATTTSPATRASAFNGDARGCSGATTVGERVPRVGALAPSVAQVVVPTEAAASPQEEVMHWGR